MKKRTHLARNLLITVLILAAVCCAGYFILFKNADILQIQEKRILHADGSYTLIEEGQDYELDTENGDKLEERKILNAKATWLTGYFTENGLEHYYKLADVSTPTGFSAVKNAPQQDEDALTTQFNYAKKDTSAGELTFAVYAVYMTREDALSQGYEEQTFVYTGRKTAKSTPDYTALVKEIEGGRMYLLDSPYSAAMIGIEAAFGEGMSEDTLNSDVYSMLEKVSPGKQLHSLVADFKLNFIDDNRWTQLTGGLGTTLLITLVSGCLGIIIGAIVAAIRSTWQKNNENMHNGFGKSLLKGADKVCGVYLTVIRGTPVMVQLLIMYLIIFASAKEGTVSAIIAFGINSGAYVAEIVRGGIMSIDNGQFEAGRSLGFNYLQTMLFIVLPQVFKAILPTLANEFIALLKETSVAGYVAVRDLNKGGENIRSVTYSAFMPLLAVAGIYLAVVMFFTWLVGKLERRLRSSDH